MTKVKDYKTVILIPAYQPSEILVNLVEKLSQQNFEILMVNDRSSENHTRIFEKISSKAHIFRDRHACSWLGAGWRFRDLRQQQRVCHLVFRDWWRNARGEFCNVAYGIFTT